jgi:hypothetical protein
MYEFPQHTKVLPAALSAGPAHLVGRMRCCDYHTKECCSSGVLLVGRAEQGTMVPPVRNPGCACCHKIQMFYMSLWWV